MKICKECSKTSDEVEFEKRRCYCKKCWASITYKRNKSWHVKRYEDNRETILERCKEYNQNHKEQWLIRSKLSKYKRRFTINTTNDKSINRKSIEQLLIKQNYKCALTWNNLLVNWKLLYHVDHIIPLSKWWPHILSNIQLTTPEANIRKWNKLNFNF